MPTMAGAVLSPVFQQLVSLARSHGGMVVGEGEIDKLRLTFTIIEQVLDDAELRQFEDESVRTWLENYKNIIHEMEDVLDEWNTEIQRRQIEGPDDDNNNISSSSGEVASYLCSLCFCFNNIASYYLCFFRSSFNNFKFRYEIGSKIKKIRERLDFIATEKDKYGFGKIMRTSRNSGAVQPKTKTSSIIVEPYVLGRDMEKKKILVHDFEKKKELQLESIGEDYFNELAALSFFQDFYVDDDGSITHCKMHDLVHDFAQFLTKNEIYVKHSRDTFSIKELGIARHAIVINDEGFVEPNSIYASLKKVEKLSTLIVFSNDYTSSSSLRDSLDADLFHHLRCLRVLSLRHIYITYLPKEIEKLIHLRYLNLSHNHWLNELPDSMSSLYNLQTLNLEDCRRLQKLPKGMGRMINLRHLYIKGTSLNYLPEGIGRLKSLQTLCEFIVGDATRGGCRIKELKDLNLLQGDITIRGLGRLKTVEEAFGAELQKKQQIHDLFLNFDIDETLPTRSGEDEEKDVELAVNQVMECVLEALQPHPNLKKLAIRNYLGLKFPSWMSSNFALTNLCHLDIGSCSNCTELPCLGSLPSLKDLNITNLPSLKSIAVETYGSNSDGKCVGNHIAFPMLKTLNISTDNLEVLEVGDGEAARGEIMPSVTTIVIECKRLNVLPALGNLPSLETLKIAAAHQVRHIGQKFYGIGNTIVGGSSGRVSLTAFPKLCSLEIDMDNLEVWELGDGVVEPGRKIMPCVKDIKLSSKKLKVLPAFGALPSLESLKIASGAVTHISHEFYGVGSNIVIGGRSVSFTTFPMLNTLEIRMNNLEIWELGDGEVEQGWKIMPCVKDITLSAMKLKVLPALGLLPSLEKFKIASRVATHIGREFYGFGSGVVTGFGRGSFTTFPVLKTLEIDVDNLEVWESGAVEGHIMPCVTIVKLSSRKLKILPPLGKLPSLETLEIRNTQIGHIDLEFFGIGGSNDIDGGVGFPKLTFIKLDGMRELKELKLGVNVGEEGNKAAIGNQITVMPCLSEIEIRHCSKLKTMRILTQLQSLKKLTLSGMENLEDFETVEEEQAEDSVMQLPCLSEFILFNCQRLKSIPRNLPKLNKLCITMCSSISQLPISPNLTTLEIALSKVLPQGIAQLKELQHLEMNSIRTLTCIPEYVQNLTKLQELAIYTSNRTLEQRCRREGEDWSIISHIPSIVSSRYKKM